MQPLRPPGIGRAILLTGLLAGTLDITAAILNFIIPNVRNPIIIFNYIASGVMGAEAAFSGGWIIAALGCILHYCIALYWTAVFFYAYPLIVKGIPNKYVAGLLYGIVVWLAMNLVVIPLSRVPQAAAFNPAQAAIGILILMVAIGLPISLRATAFYNGGSRTL